MDFHPQYLCIVDLSDDFFSSAQVDEISCPACPSRKKNTALSQMPKGKHPKKHANKTTANAQLKSYINICVVQYVRLDVLLPTQVSSTRLLGTTALPRSPLRLVNDEGVSMMKVFVSGSYCTHPENQSPPNATSVSFQLVLLSCQKRCVRTLFETPLKIQHIMGI